MLIVKALGCIVLLPIGVSTTDLAVNKQMLNVGVGQVGTNEIKKGQKKTLADSVLHFQMLIGQKKDAELILIMCM